MARMPRSFYVSRSIAQKNADQDKQIGSGVVDPVSFGADPTGVADSTSAWQAAYAKAASAGHYTLTPSPGTYTVSGRVHGASASATPVRIVAEPGTVTIQRTASVPIVEVQGGSRGATAALSSDAAVADTSVLLSALPAGITVGGYIAVESSVTSSGLSKVCEVARVKAFSNSGAPYTVALEAPLEESYAVANSSLVRVVGIGADNSHLRGITFRQTAMDRDTADAPLTRFGYTRHLRIESCSMRDADAPGVELSAYVLNAILTDVHVENLTDDIPNNRIGYGVAAGAQCRDIAIIRQTGTKVRHAFTTGDNSGWGPPRHIVLQDCMWWNCTSDCFSTHKEGKHITAIGCEVHNTKSGGFYLRAPFTKLVGCRVVNSQLNSAIDVAQGEAADCQIVNCTVINRSTFASEPAVHTDSARTRIDGLVIDSPSAAQNPIQVDGVDSTITNLWVKNMDNRNYAVGYAASIGSGHYIGGLVRIDAASVKSLASIATGTTVRLMTDPVGTAMSFVGSAGSYSHSSSVGTLLAPNNDRVSTVTGNYGVGDRDGLVLVNNAAGGNKNWQLPSAVGRTGRIFKVKKVSPLAADTVTVTTTSAQTIEGAASGSIVLNTQWQAAAFMSDGANWVKV